MEVKIEILEFKEPSQIEETERMQKFLLYRYGLVISLKEIQELYSCFIGGKWKHIDELKPKKQAFIYGNIFWKLGRKNKEFGGIKNEQARKNG